VDPAKLRTAIEELAANFGPDGSRELVVVRNGYWIHKGPATDTDR
jgi:hypothetical protein